MATRTIPGDTDAAVSGLASDSLELQVIPRLELPDDASDLSFANSLGTTPDGGPRTGCFVSKDGDVGGGSHNDTQVDVVLVACPGADPHETWTRHRLPEHRLPQHIFELLATKPHHFKRIGKHLMNSASLHTALAPVPAPSWTRSGIRSEVPMARVLTYSHGSLNVRTGLKKLANDLLQALILERKANSSRPLFFICHSIGGLVVKLALTEASRNPKYQPILEHCYGVTFFGKDDPNARIDTTPHRGSTYLSMSRFEVSIQKLLKLDAPLTSTLRDELQLGHHLLSQIDEDFKLLSCEMRIWTFSETEDSKLSGGEISGRADIPFTAPIVSLRSATLGVRHEKIYTQQSQHSDCASFGMNNIQTMKLYLKDLGDAIRKAQTTNVENPRNHPLGLEEEVQMEVHGFYEDLVTTTHNTAAIRAFSTKQTLGSFFKEGPDQLLQDRLNEIDIPIPAEPSLPGPRKNQFISVRTRSPRMIPEGTNTSLEHPQQRRTRRSSVASVLTNSGRDPSPTLSDLRGLGTRCIEVSGLTHTASAVTLEEKVATVTPSQTSSLHPGGLPSFHPNTLVSQSTSGTDTLISDASSTHAVPPTMPSPANNGAHAMLAHLNSRKNRTRRGSESTFSQDMRASFSRPDPKTQKFVWIHIPFTNPSWVRKVFDTLNVTERRDFSELFSAEHWSSRHARGRHSQHHACFVKPACNYIPYKISSDLGSPGLASPRHWSPLTSQGCTYLYFPFLHFDTYRTLIKRRDIIRRRLAQGRSKPVPASVSKTESLEQRVIWEFLGHDPPVNCRRTLDQYRYPSLHDTRARDDDQMLYKMTKERIDLSDFGMSKDSILAQHSQDNAYVHQDSGFDDEFPNENGHDDLDRGSNAESDVGESGDEEMRPEDDLLDGNVLMVDQVWLWVIDTTTLVTFFPKREGDLMEGPLYQQADLRDSIFNEVNADLTRRNENALDLAALTVLHAVTALIDRSSHPDLEIFRIFEEAISILTEKMTSSLKRFRTAGYRTKYGDDDNQTKTTSIRARHKREDEQAEKENRDNTSALLELRDIEDELSTLQHLFEEQESQVHEMLKLYRPSLYRQDSTGAALPPVDTSNGIAFLEEALAKLSTYKDQTKDMIGRVEKTRHDFDKLLETVQRQAQIDEVRLSRQQADLATAQNRSVMIFTTFTVIFLPLSFFTGLFGMNTQEWGGGDFLRLTTIGAIALPTSALLVLGALVVAWSSSVRKFFKYVRKRVQRTKTKGKRWWLSLVKVKADEKPRTKKMREMFRKKKAELEVKKQTKRLKREMTMIDFWERHRREREPEYKIPSRNRKSISIAKAKAKAKKESKERIST